WRWNDGNNYYVARANALNEQHIPVLHGRRRPQDTQVRWRVGDRRDVAYVARGVRRQTHRGPIRRRQPSILRIRISLVQVRLACGPRLTASPPSTTSAPGLSRSLECRRLERTLFEGCSSKRRWPY